MSRLRARLPLYSPASESGNSRKLPVANSQARTPYESVWGRTLGSYTLVQVRFDRRQWIKESSIVSQASSRYLGTVYSYSSESRAFLSSG